MVNFFTELPLLYQTILATLFTWGVTALGSAIIFCVKKLNQNFLDMMLSFAAGVMIAASFFSLISPAIDMANEINRMMVYTCFLGFLAGGLLLFIGDRFYKKISSKNKSLTLNKKRVFMLIFSITLHNIPEGMAIGVGFGTLIYNFSYSGLIAAWLLAIGIGIQNFPEGSAVSLPLLREGYSKKRAFMLGQLSGIVEPIAAVLGFLLVLKIKLILPFLLCFAAGAMIYVVVEELIPESQNNKNKEVIAIFAMIGFSVMMILDVLLS